MFVHDNNQPYLRAAILSAERANNFVVLLGSERNKDFCTNWYDADKFTDTGYEEFEKLYVHMSVNARWLELLCFRRYFFLYKYMVMNDVECAVMFDSDVLCYISLSDEKFTEAVKGKLVSVFAQGKDRLGDQSGPHFLFIRREALKEFIDFCIDIYKNRLDYLKQNAHEDVVNNRGLIGISDMNLLSLWTGTLDPSLVLDWHKPETRKIWRVENQLGFSEGYRMDKLLGIKDIKYIDGVPHFYELATKQWVRVYVLHFQGGAKRYMCDYFYGRPYAVKLMRGLFRHLKRATPKSIKRYIKRLIRR